MARSRTTRVSAARTKHELRVSNLFLSNAKLEHTLVQMKAAAADADHPAAAAIDGWSTFEALALVAKTTAILDSTPDLERLRIEDCDLMEEIAELESELSMSEEQEMPCSEPLTLSRLQQRLSRLLKQQQELEAAL